MSRTRLIRPEFFKDETMAGVSDPIRMFYIGLWTLCDDAGYFELRPRQIAAELYPYRTPTQREKLTTDALAKLVELERVVLLPCGIHGRVPTLPRHGAKGGTKSETYMSRHQGACLGQTSTDLRGGGGKGVHASVRDAVVARDKDRCRYCGVAASPTVRMVLDHVDNFGLGTLDNVVQACGSCNSKKGAKSLDEAAMTLLDPPSVQVAPVYIRGTDKSSSDSGSGSVGDSDSEARAREMKKRPGESIEAWNARIGTAARA